MPSETNRYLSTPIYYVNDKPHIGHLYSTVVADILARAYRHRGFSTLLSTGTDEHGLKVARSARAHGLPVARWTEENSRAFREAFTRFGIAFDDFLRTSEERHVAQVHSFLAPLLRTGDVHPGHFEGWSDETQEEYLSDSKAEESRFLSPVTGKPLVRRSEQSFFLRLEKYAPRIAEAIETGALRITPQARKDEVLSRLRAGVHDIPVSRLSDEAWGITLPGHEAHRVYVWIDALIHYLTVARSHDAQRFWPPHLHLIG